jgi:hypothetical protein
MFVEPEGAERKRLWYKLEGHTKQCYAEALISAVQNFRDNEEMTDFDFRVRVQDGSLKEEAQGYLNDGLQTCTCDPNGVPDWFEPGGDW